MIKRGLGADGGRHRLGQVDSLAAMLNYRNENSSDHILTVEDPIEFLHSNKKSIVNQREVGLDTKSFHRALRSAMRAAPDVILIGEIRDRESMEYAITFAGTGHLCLATLHANNAAETLDRIINMFPRDQHTQIFLDLSQYLKAILSQRLVPGTDGRRCAAIEVLLNTPHVQELVKKGDVMGVKEALVRSARRACRASTLRCTAVPRRQDHARGSARERGFADESRGEDQFRLRRPRGAGAGGAHRTQYGERPQSTRSGHSANAELSGFSPTQLAVAHCRSWRSSELLEPNRGSALRIEHELAQLLRT